MLALALWQLATGEHDTMTALAGRLFDGLTPPPRVSGLERIPPTAPFVALFNHYESPRAAAWWGALLIDRCITGQRRAEPRRVRWLMASEWWYPAGFGRLVKQPLTRLLFRRLAHIYGLVLVPPVIPGDLTRGQGLAGVREALALTRGPEPQLVGLAPEGHGGPDGTLRRPPPGVGSFLLLLTHGTVPCLPIGWFDEAGAITIRFGAPLVLDAPRAASRDERDRQAAAQAMTALARLLPERLRGEFGQAATCSRESLEVSLE